MKSSMCVAQRIACVHGCVRVKGIRLIEWWVLMRMLAVLVLAMAHCTTALAMNTMMQEQLDS